MVPAYLEHLPVVPMTTSDKADRKALPPPTTRRTADGEFVAPTGPTETVLAELLAATLGLERVSAAAHFFDDLGANSLLLAQFAARVRARTDAAADRDAGHVPAPHRDRARGARRRRHAGGRPRGARRGADLRDTDEAVPAGYLLCGVVQLVLFLVSVTAAAGCWWSPWSGCAAPRPSSTCGSAPWWSAPRRSAGTSCCRRRRSGCWSGGGRPRSSRCGERATCGSGSCSGSCGPTRSPCSWGRRSTTCTCGASAPASARGAVVLTRAVPVCTDLLTIGPGADRPQGHPPQRLPRRRGAHPDRPDHDRRRRGGRRAFGARHRCGAGRRRPAGPRVVAAVRAGGPGRRELARLARRPAATSTTGWSRPRGAAGCAGSPTGCGSWPTSWSCPSRSASRWSCTSSSASRSSRG